MELLVKLYHWWYENMQQSWFDDGLRLKAVIYGVCVVVFYNFLIIFKYFC